MRRRLLLAAFVLDGLCALAAPLVLSAVGGPEADDPYALVDASCVEFVQVEGADVAGRPVDEAFCEATG